MKTFTPSFLAALASGASAHTIFQEFWVNGVSAGHEVGIRVPNYDGPITDVTSDDLVCNGGPNPLNTPLPTDIVQVAAGDTVTTEWHHTLAGLDSSDSADPIDPSHKGPIMVYLAKVDNALTTTVTGLNWFKIYEDGLDSGTWAVDKMITNKGKVDVTIPSCIPDGNYLLRAELIALHAASSYPGAQFYMECAQINVSGGGSAIPATVSFPGTYSGSDPGITFKLYDNPTPYTIPGPSVFSCDGTSSSSTVAELKRDVSSGIAKPTGFRPSGSVRSGHAHSTGGKHSGHLTRTGSGLSTAAITHAPRHVPGKRDSPNAIPYPTGSDIPAFSDGDLAPSHHHSGGFGTGAHSSRTHTKHHHSGTGGPSSVPTVAARQFSAPSGASGFSGTFPSMSIPTDTSFGSGFITGGFPSGGFGTGRHSRTRGSQSKTSTGTEFRKFPRQFSSATSTKSVFPGAPTGAFPSMSFTSGTGFGGGFPTGGFGTGRHSHSGRPTQSASRTGFVKVPRQIPSSAPFPTGEPSSISFPSGTGFGSGAPTGGWGPGMYSETSRRGTEPATATMSRKFPRQFPSGTGGFTGTGTGRPFPTGGSGMPGKHSRTHRPSASGGAPDPATKIPRLFPTGTSSGFPGFPSSLPFPSGTGFPGFPTGSSGAPFPFPSTFQSKVPRQFPTGTPSGFPGFPSGTGFPFPTVGSGMPFPFPSTLKTSASPSPPPPMATETGV